MKEQDVPAMPLWVRCGAITAADLRNMTRVLLALAAWAALFVAASQLIKRDLLPAGAIPWVVAALPTVAGAFVILAYARFLREADELQRTVQLRALALGFGGGWFVMTGYRIFERLGAPPADGADFTLALAVCYSIGILLGWRRYR